MKFLVLFLLVPCLAWSQDPVARQSDIQRLEQQQRTIIGTMRDAQMREEFRQSNERLNTMANEPLRQNDASDRANQQRVQEQLRR
jgi:hypothetical protein